MRMMRSRRRNDGLGERCGRGLAGAPAQSKRQRTKVFSKIRKPNYSYIYYLLIDFHISSRHIKIQENVRTVLWLSQNIIPAVERLSKSFSGIPFLGRTIWRVRTWQLLGLGSHWWHERLPAEGAICHLPLHGERWHHHGVGSGVSQSAGAFAFGG